MLKETDMNGVRKTARLFLMLEPVPTKLTPMVVKHPFTDSGFVTMRGAGDNPVKMVNIMEDQKALHQWREEKTEQIRAMKEPRELFAMLTKSYYMVFLKYTMPYLSQKDFSEYLSTAWICDENPNSDPNFTTQKLVGLFKKADPEMLMTSEEREQLQALPDPVTVYRGVTSFNAKRIKALSWTLDRDTAQWFANRFGEKGTVYTAQISKEHICALFHGRNESEIILDPKYLMDITATLQAKQSIKRLGPFSIPKGKDDTQMQAKIKRLLSMLIVFVLVLGLFPSAAAATDDGTKDITEPIVTEETTPPETTVPPEGTEPDDPTAPIEPTDPPETEPPSMEGTKPDPVEEWDPLEPTPEDLERWAELASQLPDTIVAEWPFDSSVRYPYGEPQENYYPGILLEPDPYGSSLLADMSLIPEEMYDNAMNGLA